MDTAKELPTVIAFCAGYGGIERGLELAGIEHRVIAYVEIEAFAIANLVQKMEAGQLPPAPIYTDIKTFPAEVFRGKVSIITGGYPCQPFSKVGNRLGEDDPRHLWPHIRRHIESIRPSRCFLENVEGHISLGLSTVISDLEKDGYQSAWGIFSAAEVGAPHQRKRVFIMADSDGSGQQAQRDEPRAERKAQAISQSSKLANSCGKGLQRSSASRNFIGKKQESNDKHATRRCSTQVWSWPTEPRVGRVADGVADRVDRIRLLGNGVVPQTAAEAWKVLSERLV